MTLEREAGDVSLPSIHGYHAHVYFRDAAERERALKLREGLGANFPVALGRVMDRNVGPHTLPMYQVAFAAEQFATVVPFLMLARAGLTVLVHPETGDEVADHTEHALWLGEVLPVDVEFLRQFVRGHA